MKIGLAKQSFENLYGSEVYRELERQAVRKGHFNPTPEQTVKLAAQQLNQKILVNAEPDMRPTGDLMLDIGLLVNALNRKGYVVQAEELATNLMLYKQAETALYNVQNERAKDLMEMAHSDGDVDIADQGELGEVETVQSAAAKILSVVNKTPKGKLAALARVIKQAAPADAAAPEVKPTDVVKQIYSDFNKSISGMTVAPEVVKFKTFDDLVKDPNNIKAFAAITGQTPESVNQAVTTRTAIGQIGLDPQFGLSEQGFAQIIRGGINDSSKAQALASAVGADPGLFKGVSAYYVNGSAVSPEKMIEVKGELNKGGFNGVSNPNPQSPYIQQIRVPIQDIAGSAITGAGVGGVGGALGGVGSAIAGGLGGLAIGSALGGILGAISVLWEQISSTFSVNEARVTELAAMLFKLYQARVTAVFGDGDSKITGAGTTLQSKIAELSAELDKIKATAPAAFVDENGDISKQTVMDPLYKTRDLVDEFLGSDKVKAMSSVMDMLGIPTGSDPIASTKSNVGKALENSESKLVTSVGGSSKQISIQPMLNALNAARAAWVAVKKAKPTNKDANTMVQTLRDVITRLNNIGDNKSANKSEAFVLDFLRSHPPILDYPTPEALISDMSVVINQAKSAIGEK